MNAAHLHLIFTHLPVIGIFFAIMVNIFAIVKRDMNIARVSLWLYVFVGIGGALAYFTGDSAAELLEKSLGYAENKIEPHENLALFFFIGLSLVSVVSIYLLYISRKKEIDKKWGIFLLIAALIVCLLGIFTAVTGGSIRHTENQEISAGNGNR